MNRVSYFCSNMPSVSKLTSTDSRPVCFVWSNSGNMFHICFHSNFLCRNHEMISAQTLVAVTTVYNTASALHNGVRTSITCAVDWCLDRILLPQFWHCHWSDSLSGLAPMWSNSLSAVAILCQKSFVISAQVQHSPEGACSSSCASKALHLALTTPLRSTSSWRVAILFRR